MRIVHLSRPDRNGAGSVTFSVHKLLLENGIDSVIITKYGDSKTSEFAFKSTHEFHKEKLLGKIKALYSLKKETVVNKDYYMHSINESIGWISDKRINKVLSQIGHIDLFILYFLDNFLSIKNIYNIQRQTGAKVIFYPMDMAIMTGGCHYSWECTNYQRSCGSCPGIFSSDHKDVTNKNFLSKSHFLSKLNYEVLAPTETLYNQLRLSSLFKQAVIKKLIIPIDENVFQPIDINKAREFFSISLDKKVLFYGAQGINEKRKGFSLLLDFLNILKNYYSKEQILILLAGQCSQELLKNIPFEYKYLGVIDLTKELPFAYNSADIYISTSVQDSGPMMINQALLCGTPVIAFNVGVAPDLIKNGQNGFIINNFNCNDMSTKAIHILNMENDKYYQMRFRTREYSLKINSLKTFYNEFQGIIN